MLEAKNNKLLSMIILAALTSADGRHSGLWDQAEDRGNRIIRLTTDVMQCVWDWLFYASVVWEARLISQGLIDKESSAYLFNNHGETHLHLIGRRELSALRQLDPIEENLPESAVHSHTWT